MERYAAEQIATGQEWGAGGNSHHALPEDVSSECRLLIRSHLPEVPTFVNRPTLAPKPS